MADSAIALEKLSHADLISRVLRLQRQLDGEPDELGERRGPVRAQSPDPGDLVLHDEPRGQLEALRAEIEDMRKMWLQGGHTITELRGQIAKVGQLLMDLRTVAGAEPHQPILLFVQELREERDLLRATLAAAVPG